jgi:hypothetical protein
MNTLADIKMNAVTRDMTPDDKTAAKKLCKQGGGKAPCIVTVMPKGSEIDGLSISYPAGYGFLATKLGMI